jgi:hypothetical protein
MQVGLSERKLARWHLSTCHDKITERLEAVNEKLAKVEEKLAISWHDPTPLRA